MLSAVIMAGGFGKRFWPASRRNMPKQCLPIISDNPMIKETIERLLPIIPAERIFISTGRDLENPIKKILPGINYVVEPMAKNTAACIGLSAATIMQKYPDAIMFIETSDHVYDDMNAYHEHISKAAEMAKKNKIVLIGIKPEHPHTGFGYIRQGNKIKDKIYEVKQFKEKPDLETAKKYVESGEYLWNSGMFIAKCSVMLDEIKLLMPELYNGLMKIKDSDFDKKTMQDVFQNLKSISIDYGVMEKSKNIVMLRGEMHWDDVGDWDAMDRLHKKDENSNVIHAKHSGDAKNCIIFSEDEIRTGDIKDLIIINTKDCLFICRKTRSQEVKKIVDELEKNNELITYTIDFVKEPKPEFIGIDTRNCEINANCLVATIGVENLFIQKDEKGVVVNGRNI